ncbi:hypothetical protein Ancab_012802 [Ancistrocladus abbreviatus]
MGKGGWEWEEGEGGGGSFGRKGRMGMKGRGGGGDCGGKGGWKWEWEKGEGGGRGCSGKGEEEKIEAPFVGYISSGSTSSSLSNDGPFLSRFVVCPDNLVYWLK